MLKTSSQCWSQDSAPSPDGDAWGTLLCGPAPCSVSWARGGLHFLPLKIRLALVVKSSQLNIDMIWRWCFLQGGPEWGWHTAEPWPATAARCGRDVIFLCVRHWALQACLLVQPSGFPAFQWFRPWPVEFRPHTCSYCPAKDAGALLSALAETLRALSAHTSSLALCPDIRAVASFRGK